MKVPLLCRRPVRGWPWPWRHGVFRNTKLFKFPRPSVRHPIHHGRDNEVLLSRPPARPPALCPPLPNFSLPCGPSIATGPSFDVNGHWLTYLSREAPRKAPGEARPLLRHLISFLPCMASWLSISSCRCFRRPASECRIKLRCARSGDSITHGESPPLDPPAPQVKFWASHPVESWAKVQAPGCVYQNGNHAIHAVHFSAKPSSCDMATRNLEEQRPAVQSVIGIA